MADPIKLWRYYLPSENGQGWAEIVLCSSGFFGAVSDWGNHSFAWRAFGDGDFREFVAGLDAGYLEGKLGACSGHSDEFDAEKSLRAIRTHIIEARRGGALTKEQARKEFDLTKELEDEPSQIGATRWYDQTEIQDANELLRYSPPTDLVEFCKRVMPRLAAVLRAELEVERAQEAANG